MTKDIDSDTQSLEINDTVENSRPTKTLYSRSQEEYIQRRMISVENKWTRQNSKIYKECKNADNHSEFAQYKPSSRQWCDLDQSKLSKLVEKNRI